jgi:NAD dependent epimerase/dehydratase
MNRFWHGKKALVTGAGGFIGSHLVERLVSEGASVRAFVRYTSRHDVGWLSESPKDVLREVEIVAGDLRDPDAVDRAVDSCPIVFHLGALIAIPYSYLHPVEVAETNIMGTINVLKACDRNHVDRLVHTSTSEVYGTARRVPIDEDHPLQGQSPYSASKIGADKLAESFRCAYRLPVVTVRPFNTFGPRQSARAVIPAVITQALSRSVIKLGNLETIRDFTYVADTVEGFVKAAETPHVEGKVLNLGTGSEISIGALVERILRLTGSSAMIEVDPVRLRPEASEVLRLVSDNAQARAALGWTPRTSLDDGLRLTIDWIREHLHCYRVGFYEV